VSVPIDLECRRRHSEVQRPSQQHRQIERDAIEPDELSLLDVLPEGLEQRVLVHRGNGQRRRPRLPLAPPAHRDNGAQIRIQGTALELLGALLRDVALIFSGSRKLAGASIGSRYAAASESGAVSTSKQTR
jgi:hypothetical protein